MKKVFFIGLLFHSVLSLGQTISGQTYLQKTIMGVQKGFGLRIQNDLGWGLGAIHQSNLESSKEGLNETYPFYGLELIAPMTKCGNMQFFLSPKIGFVNKFFFIIIPEVETEVKISNRISAAVIAGIRAREASTGLKILVHL